MNIPPSSFPRFSSPLAEVFARQCRSWMQAGAVGDEGQGALSALAGALIEATEAGHVCLDLRALGEGFDLVALPQDPRAWRQTGIVRLPEDAPGCPLVLDGHRLYLARHYRAEVNTAHRLSAMARAGRLCIISGGPGTGKTTTVARLLGRWLAQQASTRIVLAAPTGKAAARMMQALRTRADQWPKTLRERLPEAALTIHRLLGWNPRTGQPRHDASHPLWLDVLIVDEASMLDQTLAAALLDALPTQARLILLGDKDQLAAVEAGAVFAELSEIPGCLPADSVALDAWLDGILDLGMTAETRQQVASARLAAKAAAHKAAQRRVRRLERLAGRQGELFADLPERPVEPVPEVSSVVGEAIPPVGERGLPDCVVWLEHSYRFVADSALGRVAAAVRDGDVARALHTLRQASHQPDQACAWLDESHLSAKARAWLLSGYQPYWQALSEHLRQGEQGRAGAMALLEVFDRFRVLAAVHRGPRGVSALNHLLDGARQSHLLAAGLGEAAALAGRPVLILENHPATGLFNGDVGLVLPLSNDDAEIVLPGAGGLFACFPALSAEGIRKVPLAALPHHDLGFVLTVHKSQGSEFDRVALVLPDEESPVLTRELVYTALTRARQGLAVLASADVLAAAIARPTSRDSALGERLG